MLRADTIYGVWGYGVGGRAVTDFLLEQGMRVVVHDRKQPVEQEMQQLAQRGVTWIAEEKVFLSQADRIIPSAGIDLRGYETFSYKWLAEFDIFAAYWHKPIIAITGTLGKTTVTHTIGHCLQVAGRRVAVGGNIGVGLCSLLAQKNTVDYAVLEMSSFQLQLCKNFAPHVAVWTNFFPNHLDRHTTVEEYFDAKAVIVRNQPAEALSIVPHRWREAIAKHSCYAHEWRTITVEGYAQNRACVQAVMDGLGIPLVVTDEMMGVGLEHRVEFVRAVRGISFYNDSKSTVPQATLAALERFANKSVILLLGGLSKGVSREAFVKQLAGRVKLAVCVGVEAEQLAGWCADAGIAYVVCPSMDDAVKMAYNKGTSGDVVLLSPSGSSFDLFKNYKERGAVFKQLVSLL